MEHSMVQNVETIFVFWIFGHWKSETKIQIFNHLNNNALF